jgi:hypothetical protein
MNIHVMIKLIESIKKNDWEFDHPIDTIAMIDDIFNVRSAINSKDDVPSYLLDQVIAFQHSNEQNKVEKIAYCRLLAMTTFTGNDFESMMNALEHLGLYSDTIKVSGINLSARSPFNTIFQQMRHYHYQQSYSQQLFAKIQAGIPQFDDSALLSLKRSLISVKFKLHPMSVAVLDDANKIIKLIDKSFSDKTKLDMTFFVNDDDDELSTNASLEQDSFDKNKFHSPILLMPFLWRKIVPLNHAGFEPIQNKAQLNQFIAETYR